MLYILHSPSLSPKVLNKLTSLQTFRNHMLKARWVFKFSTCNKVKIFELMPYWLSKAESPMVSCSTFPMKKACNRFVRKREGLVEVVLE